MNKSLNCW